MGYQEKFTLLNEWINEIIVEVEKDLKKEHLRIDKKFCRRYFLGKNPKFVHIAEMGPAYLSDITSGNIGLAEFIATRWVYKNSSIYYFFEEALKEIASDFETIEKIEDAVAQTVIEKSIENFGAIKTYLFAVLNSVVFSELIFADLKARAQHERR